jgi:hypothetical protein
MKRTVVVKLNHNRHIETIESHIGYNQWYIIYVKSYVAYVTMW